MMMRSGLQSIDAGMTELAAKARDHAVSERGHTGRVAIAPPTEELDGVVKVAGQGSVGGDVFSKAFDQRRIDALQRNIALDPPTPIDPRRRRPAAGSAVRAAN